ncbi:MAG: hypothetical protein I4O51_02930 [Flavobacterium micromati]|nr:hypothetical protein [Flavobacterium micromati]
MKYKIAITLFLGILAGSSFGQKINVAKLDSLFQILETKDKFMGSIAVSQNGTLLYSKSNAMNELESNKKSTILLSKNYFVRIINYKFAFLK